MLQRPWQGLAVAQDHGERIRGFVCPGFQIWGDVQATARVQE